MLAVSELHGVIAALRTMDAKEDDDVAKGLAAAVTLVGSPTRDRQQAVYTMCRDWHVERQEKSGANGGTGPWVPSLQS